MIMDEIKKKRCGKCDYMNNDIPISKKKPNCMGIPDCEIYLRTIRLEHRIEYLRGERGPTFYSGKEPFIDFYTEEG